MSFATTPEKSAIEVPSFTFIKFSLRSLFVIIMVSLNMKSCDTTKYISEGSISSLPRRKSWTSFPLSTLNLSPFYLTTFTFTDDTSMRLKQTKFPKRSIPFFTSCLNLFPRISSLCPKIFKLPMEVLERLVSSSSLRFYEPSENILRIQSYMTDISSLFKSSFSVSAIVSALRPPYLLKPSISFLVP